MAEKNYLGVEEVAELFGLTTGTIYRLVQTGALPGFKVGNKWRFSRQMLDTWAADQVTIKWLKKEEKNQHDQYRRSA